MAGQQCRGAGVDCTHLVAAVLDALLGCAVATVLPRAPQDSMLHGMASEVAAGALRAVSRVHTLEPVEPDADGLLQVEPGDVLVCRVTPGSGPGHAMIVGGVRRMAYHAHIRHGVVEQAMPAPADLFHVWRSAHRDRWLEVLRAEVA